MTKKIALPITYKYQSEIATQTKGYFITQAQVEIVLEALKLEYKARTAFGEIIPIDSDCLLLKAISIFEGECR